MLHRTADDYMGDLWELPSGGVDEGEDLVHALHREVEEETGLVIASIVEYLGHFDYLSKSGKRTRQFNFGVTTGGGPVALTEHDEHLWADTSGQRLVSPAVQDVLKRWHDVKAE
ncbi:NUDIX hydrolase [Streptomyces pathocidini]|uniref:NUDIX hydrolase n=2 Tax=Streptomyces pathocidini TaxID=1650571 RepID=A0ABW7UWE2_9ACTN